MNDRGNQLRRLMCLACVVGSLTVVVPAPSPAENLVTETLARCRHMRDDLDATTVRVLCTHRHGWARYTARISRDAYTAVGIRQEYDRELRAYPPPEPFQLTVAREFGDGGFSWAIAFPEQLYVRIYKQTKKRPPSALYVVPRALFIGAAIKLNANSFVDLFLGSLESQEVNMKIRDGIVEARSASEKDELQIAAVANGRKQLLLFEMVGQPTFPQIRNTFVWDGEKHRFPPKVVRKYGADVGKELELFSQFELRPIPEQRGPRLRTIAEEIATAPFGTYVRTTNSRTRALNEHYVGGQDGRDEYRSRRSTRRTKNRRESTTRPIEPH